MLDAVRIGERSPTITVDRCRPIAAAVGVELVDGHDLPLRAAEQIAVLITPPGRNVCPEGLALVSGIGAGTRIHVEDADFENVPLFGTANCDRPGHDVDAIAGAGAVGSIHRAGAAPVHILLLLGPVIDAFRSRIALDHPFRIVAGLVR